MGNNNSPQGLEPRLSGWEAIPGAVDKRLYRNQTTGEQIQGYRFLMNDVTEFGRQRQAYDMRFNSNTLVASRYLIEDNESDLCSTYYKGELFLESTPYRLSEIDEIPYPDILHLYSQCFKGFGHLYQFAGYFDVTEDLICINRQGQVKVWLNPSLQKAKPEVSYGAFSTEGEMVNRVIAIINKNTNHSTLPENIGNVLLQSKSTSFALALKVLNQIVARHRISIPLKLKSAQQLMNRTIPIIPITNPQAIHSSIQSKLQYQPTAIQVGHQQQQSVIVTPIATARMGDSQQHLLSSTIPLSTNQSVRFSKNLTPLGFKGPIIFPQQTHSIQQPQQSQPVVQPVFQQVAQPPVQHNFTQKQISHHPHSQNKSVFQTNQQPSLASQSIHRTTVQPVQHINIAQAQQLKFTQNSHIAQTQPIVSSPTPISHASKLISNNISPLQFKNNQQSKLKKRQIQQSTQFLNNKQPIEEIVGTSQNRLINRNNQNQNVFKHLSAEKERISQNKTLSQLKSHDNFYLKQNKITERDHHQQLIPQFRGNTNLSAIREGIQSKNNRRTISLEHHSLEGNRPQARIQTQTKTQFFNQKTQRHQPVPKIISQTQSYGLSSPQKATQQHHIHQYQHQQQQYQPKVMRISQAPLGQIKPSIQGNHIGVQNLKLQTESDMRLSNTPINNFLKTPNNGNTLKKPKLQISADSQGCSSPQILAMIRGGDSAKSATKNISSFSNQKISINQEPAIELSSFPLQFNSIKTTRKYESVSSTLSPEKSTLNHPYIVGQIIRSPQIQNVTTFQHYSASKFRKDVDELEKKIDSLNQENELLQKDIIQILTKPTTS